MSSGNIDINAPILLNEFPDVFDLLLKDCTSSTKRHQRNIIWGSDIYVSLGKGYGSNDQLSRKNIMVDGASVIIPRSMKNQAEKQERSRVKAEVSTPAWICNKQNNIVDTKWFGRENVFNIETDSDDGPHYWTVNPAPVEFPEGKTWMDYVCENRMEITCGEAPYLASRYDAVTGEYIPIGHRVGILDRKLRIVAENTSDSSCWLYWAKKAFMSTYGYEWQGDNLFLARQTMLYSFIEAYEHKFGTKPAVEVIMEITDIIVWNLWQMDGLKGVIPDSCNKAIAKGGDAVCRGCENHTFTDHTGKYCRIMDWDKHKSIKFVSLMKNV